MSLFSFESALNDDDGLIVDDVGAPPSLMDEFAEECYELATLEDLMARGMRQKAALETIQSQITPYLSKGGMSKEVASGFVMTFEALGMSVGESVQYSYGGIIPSLEEFENVNSRQIATEVSIQGAKDFIKKWWNRFVTWLENWSEKVKSFFMKITTQYASRLASAAKALREKASQLPGDAKPKTPKKKLSGQMRRAMYYDKDVISKADVGLKIMASRIGNLKDESDFTKPLENKIKEVEEMIGGSVAEIKAKYVELAGNAGKNFDEAISLMEKAGLSSGAVPNHINDVKKEGDLTFASPELMQCKIVVGTVGSTDGIITSFGLKEADLLPDMKEITKDAEEDFLKNKGEIIKLLDGVISLSEAIVKSKTNAGKRSDLVKKLKAAGATVAKRLDGLKSELKDETATEDFTMESRRRKPSGKKKTNEETLNEAKADAADTVSSGTSGVSGTEVYDYFQNYIMSIQQMSACAWGPNKNELDIGYSSAKACYSFCLDSYDNLKAKTAA